MPSRFDELPDDRREREAREDEYRLEVADRRRKVDRDDRLQAQPPTPPSADVGSSGVPASREKDRLYTSPWPKYCGCCDSTYGPEQFARLSLNGVLGFIRKGIKSSLEMRDCACGNTLSHLVETEA